MRLRKLQVVRRLPFLVLLAAAALLLVACPSGSGY
jgi:type IV pilus biogenesis protein CpaD/CtpE